MTDFDKLATSLFGLYWGPHLIEADVLIKERVTAIKEGAEPTLEERRALVNLGFAKRAAISDAIRPMQRKIVEDLNPGMVE